MEELLKSLIYIQQNLNAPKDRYNSFGKFNYRSLESIEAAIKPLLNECRCGIRFSDEVVEHCGRTFLKTTLAFFNEKGECITTTAEAEHASEKTGMDSAQITGAASSYARKYAMNAMFAIDDTQDADTDEYAAQTTQRQYTPSPRNAKKTQARKTDTPQPETPPFDRYAGIRSEIDGATDMKGLMAIYTKYRSLVDTDAKVKSMFTQAKNNINRKAA